MHELASVRDALGTAVHDATDPVGRLLFNVLAMVAEFEAELIPARTREGMRVVTVARLEVTGALLRTLSCTNTIESMLSTVRLEPMVDATERELTAIGIDALPEVVLADAGYWHHVQMDALAGRGMQVLIPPDVGKRKGSRPGWDGGRYAFMRRVLETERGGGLYVKRQGMIEPVFADTKFNRRCDRFQRRGRSAARSEWRLITATHNLLKLWRHTTAPLPA